VLHLLDRRVGWCYAHPCAATRPGSTQVVLLIGTGVCASGCGRRAGCRAVACGGGYASVPTVLCIQVRDVAEPVWYGGRSYGLIGAERSDLPVLSVVRFARCNVWLTFLAVQLAPKEA